MTELIYMFNRASAPLLGIDGRLLATICGAAIGLGVVLILFNQVRHRVRNEANLHPVSRPGLVLILVGAICLGVAALHPAGQLTQPDLIVALLWAAPVSIAMGTWSAWANTHISHQRERYIAATEAGRGDDGTRSTAA